MLWMVKGGARRFESLRFISAIECLSKDLCRDLDFGSADGDWNEVRWTAHQIISNVFALQKCAVATYTFGLGRRRGSLM